MNTPKDLQYKLAIANAFSAAATTYDQAAYVEQEIGRRLLERLAFIKIQPRCILDLGCGTGYFTQQLHNLFPTATIIGVDLAFGMVKYATNMHCNHDNIKYSCGDAEQLPFSDHTFDLIFSNCSLMHMRNLNTLSDEVHRVLKLQGLLLFTSLGPTSLQELAMPAPWLDMHYLGDALLQAQFKDPVVDVEMLQFTYPTLRSLLQDLQGTGAYQIDDLAQIVDIDLPCAANFEVIYGHAWGKQQTPKQYKDTAGNIYIAANNIKCL